MESQTINLDLPKSVLNDLEMQIRRSLDRCGLFYRLFSGVKTSLSIEQRIQLKNYADGKKMQDLLGCRIACYFHDDIPILQKILKSIFDIDNISQDNLDADTFKPIRLNYVCKLPPEVKRQIDPSVWAKYPIDDTFEIQIRTIFSEGWHEIEHDLRYKCKDSWSSHDDLSRNLNGILATLETCDCSILSIFDKLAYRNYQQCDWGSMIRNKLRIRLIQNSIPEWLNDYLDRNREVAKRFFQFDRDELFMFLSSVYMPIPLMAVNVIFCINELSVGLRSHPMAAW